MDILRGLLGIGFLIGVCYLFSNNRKAIDWKLVFSGLMLQIIFALLVLRTPFVYNAFQWVGNFFVQIIQFTDAGSAFVLGVWPNNTQVIDGEANNVFNVGFIFIFKVLPTIISFQHSPQFSIIWAYYKKLCTCLPGS